MNDPDNERALGLLIVLAGAFLAGPALLTQLGTRAINWCLTHHVLTSAPQSLITIPGTHAGLDGRRLLILALAAVTLTTITRLVRRHRQEKSA